MSPARSSQRRASDLLSLPLGFRDELVVDNFAGGGGASTGIEQALGRSVDIAVNHDPEAVAMHTINHPGTKHFCESVFKVDPEEITDNQPVGLAWFSPDCKHFSKAKGGVPVSPRVRGLAWVVIRWARRVKPRVIMLENVEEFQDWGPLADEGKPCLVRKGMTFRLWMNQLRGAGYKVEHRELRACDYGAPTIRKRLFVIARRDGQPIVWPVPTHGAPKSEGVLHGKMLPWRTAADCIDWSIPCPSIFERSRPLAENTLRRIARGIQKYVIDAAEPFIVRIGQTGGNGSYSNPIDLPLTTITTKAEHLLISPTLVQTGYGEREGQAPRSLDLHAPLGTVVGTQKHALVTAFMAQHNTGVTGHRADKPLSTLTGRGTQQQIVTAQLIGCGGRAGQSRPRDASEPAATITSKADTCVATSHLVKLRGTCKDGQPVDEPAPTITSGGTHVGEVRAFLIKYYGVDQDPRLEEPLHTVTTRDRFGLVTIHGEEWQIVDIGMRMLTPRELYRAQGFPESTIIDFEFEGKPLTKTAQVRMCGNSVAPPIARALVEANFEHERLIARAA